MVTIQIDRWNDGSVFTGWSPYARSRLADLLKTACPAMRQTERKRVAKSIIKRECFVLELRDASSGHSTLSFLQALGASVTLSDTPVA